MKRILQKENKLLRKIATHVVIKEITGNKVQGLIKDMKGTMGPIHDAVAIAAPQIGVSLRIFIVSGKVFMSQSQSTDEKDTKQASQKSDDTMPKPNKEDLVCINPEIIKQSKEKENMEEGCLSVRWLYGYVKRSKKVTLRAYDENGKRFTRGASGLLAQIFQHETDHLNGTLFIDKATGLRNLPPQEKKK